MISLTELIYSEIPLEMKKTKSQLKVDNEIELMRRLDYYQEVKTRSQLTKEAIETKNISKLTEIFLHDFRDEQLCKAMALATIYPKGNTKENVPTKKDNEAFFRKRANQLKKLNKLKQNKIKI